MTETQVLKYKLDDILREKELKLVKLRYRELMSQLAKRLEKHPSIISRHRHATVDSKVAMSTDQLKIYCEVLRCKPKDILR